ncbi:MAG: VIT1/CCC1 transporter family protein [Ilumatobacteraceae bacterium]
MSRKVSGREPHSGHRSVSGGLARASVFGVNDGLVSNVSLILGFAATGVDNSVVQLAGIAGAVAGGISMAAGEWVSVSAQNDLVQREVDVERRELRHNPVHETAELAERYEEQGMDPEHAREAAAAVMERPEVALTVHTREELGIDPDELPSPYWAAGLSLVCFLFGAVLPLVPWFVTSGGAAAVVSVSIGVVAAAVVGALVGRFAELPLPRSIARQVGIVLVACAITFVIGQAVGVNLD